MEALKEALISRNIIAWVIVAIILILFLKLLKTAGKGLLILLGALILIVALYRFFPGFVEPLVEFVAGGWMGD